MPDFICVNVNAAKDDEWHCTLCTTPIGKSYVRDLSTRLVYHNLWCLDSHIKQSVLCIEDAARLAN